MPDREDENKKKPKIEGEYEFKDKDLIRKDLPTPERILQHEQEQRPETKSDITGEQELRDQQRLREIEEEQRKRREEEEREFVRQQMLRQARQQATAGLKTMGRKSLAAGARGAGIAASAVWSALAAAAPYILPVLAVILIIGLIIFLVVSVIVVICNPTEWKGKLAKFAFTTVVPAQVCEAVSGFQGVVGRLERGAPPPSKEFCATPELLASQSNTPFPRRNDPDLDRLVACIVQKEPVSQNLIFSFDVSHPTCNYTRGATVCGACSHSENSCHYGGETGATGAFAVDFSVKGEKGAKILKASQVCSQTLNIPLKRATCEDSKADAVACRNVQATHVHISIAKCDKDRGPINTD